MKVTRARSWTAAVALSVLMYAAGCSLSVKEYRSEQADLGWYISLSIDAPESRSVSVSEYRVSRVAIEVDDPAGAVLQNVVWNAGDGPRTYQIPVNREGRHHIAVTHVGVQDGDVVEATESADFNILSMVITLIHIVPGNVGLISVEPERPDLVVSSLAVTCWTPTTITWSYTIKNIGNGPASLDGPTSANSDNVSVQAYLSADTVFGNGGDVAAGGTIIGSSPLGVLNPGETFTGSFTASATVDPGATPYLVLKVDWGEAVPESNEANNTTAAAIGRSCLPDLVVSSLVVTSWTSTSIAYDYTITNVGSMPANLDGPTADNTDNVSVQAYLSYDAVFANIGDVAAGGTIVGFSPLGNLDPGESISGSFESETTPDRFKLPFLILKVDAGGVVDEADENNNTKAVTY
jgi:hypothetical protein